MTIGRNSRKSSVRISNRAPMFLDKSSGFYSRLDEAEADGKVRGKEVEDRMKDSNREEGVVSPSVVHIPGADEQEEAEVFDFNEEVMGDDAETLLQRKPSRRSSRWRSSRRKQKEGRAEEDSARDERPSMGTESPMASHTLEDASMTLKVEMERLEKMDGVGEERGREPTLVHFPARKDADDQVLIRDKKMWTEEEGEEERRMRKEQEDGMKVVKRNAVKNYRKAFDQAFRRGWEAFITNLYGVTLMPVTSSSLPSSSSSMSKKKRQHSSVLAEFQ